MEPSPYFAAGRFEECLAVEVLSLFKTMKEMSEAFALRFDDLHPKQATPKQFQGRS